MRIAWAEPADNGEALTGYQIEILHADGTTFSQETSSCDGTSSTATQCDVPIATLAAAPYSLTYGTLIRAKVLAINPRGSGAFSQVNSAGARMQTPPLQDGISCTWEKLPADRTL